MKLERGAWLDLARKVDWTFSYVSEEEAFPETQSGRPWLPGESWRDWDEPYRTSFPEYVRLQEEKESSVRAVREALGRLADVQSLDASWVNGVKFHAAVLPLAEFAAVVGNLRAARFARDSAWRQMATFGALDETRHTQIPLLLMHELVRWDGQFDWTHRFYHTRNWVSIAARHLFDELLLCSDPIEFAVATNFVFETGFTNLQFVALSAAADRVRDHSFRNLITSIQTDEARHAQIGGPVLEKLMQHDPAYAQFLLDKWFWRSWQVFSVLTGFSMDYLTPVERRGSSFKEFMQEWIIDQFEESLRQYGLAKPWYWEQFLRSLDYYHHMVYASAYTYRATVWFDLALPGPEERAWLAEKYPESWPQIDPIWEQVTERWRGCDPGVDFGVHGTSIIGFCALCQLVLCQGTPAHNEACTLVHEGRKRIFCSKQCRWIFEQQPERYAEHLDLVHRVLTGECPGNLVAVLTQYFDLRYETWGKDVNGGVYPWLDRSQRSSAKAES